MKVRAIKDGFYGFRVRPGFEFDIEDEKKFSSKWMEKVGVVLEEIEQVAQEVHQSGARRRGRPPRQASDVMKLKT